MKEKKFTFVVIFVNAFLFLIKLIAGIISNSISVIIDSVNSLFDVLCSSLVFYTISLSKKKPDKNHQFGHNRMQPLTAIFIAILTSVVGFQFLLSSFERLLSGKKINLGFLPLIVMGLVVIIKIILYFKSINIFNKTKSVALKAAAQDHRNDIFIALTVFIGVFLSNYGLNSADAIVGIIVSCYVIYSGFVIGNDNLKYLVGEAPDDDVFDKIEKISLSVPGVIDINDISAQMLGTEIQAEVHLYLDKNLSLEKAHSVGNKVKLRLEKNLVGNAFVHLDPYDGEKISRRRFK